MEGGGLPSDLDNLIRWDLDDPANPEVRDRVAALPGFEAAARALSQRSLQLYESDRAAAGITKDGGRYVVAMVAMYLHIMGGLTLPSLKTLCASFGLTSPGRARAMLLYMRYLKYVEPTPKARRGAPTHYHPTPAFVTAWRGHLIAAVEAAAIAEPALAPRLDALRGARALDILTRIQTEGLHAAAKSHAAAAGSPLYRVFVHRHAGSQILWTLLTPDGAEGFPPKRSPPQSAASLARRFGVSRIHVRRLIEDAVREGLIRHESDGSAVFEPDGVAAVTFHFSMQLASLLRAASKTLLELDIPERQVA